MAPKPSGLSVRLGSICALLALVGCGGHSSGRGSTIAATTTAPASSGTPAPVPSGPGLRGVIVEDFTSLATVDSQNTTASWGLTVVGRLVPSNAAFGDGSGGDFTPTANVTLTTGNGPLQFRRVRIPANVTVTATGPDPLVILCQGEFVLEGTIDVSGADGEHGRNNATPKGGAGGPGGAKGGDGAPTGFMLAGKGEGPGGGDNNGDTGAGAGHALAGSDGMLVQGNPGVQPGSGGPAYGNGRLDPLQGGSGGSGGMPYKVIGGFGPTPGPGGGGGGGALSIASGRDLILRGAVHADGGHGGGYARNNTGTEVIGGGGGSGGAVLLRSGTQLRLEGGLVTARGGGGGQGDNDGEMIDTASTGGNGSPGRIRLEDSDGTIEGLATHIYPRPHFARPAQAFTGGNGGLGAFNATPGQVTTLDTTNGPLHYTSFTIPAGATVRATGPNPLEIFSTGDIVIDGTLDVSGAEGSPALPGGSTPPAGGAGGPGGHPGGGAGSEQGAVTVVTAQSGQGPGGGAKHTAIAGGGGGGYGTPGHTGNALTLTTGAAGGAVYGNPQLSQLEGGSGGAGGESGDTRGRWTGASGGGGGGAVRLQAKGDVVIRGEVLAEGGNGGGKPDGVSIQAVINTFNFNAIARMLDNPGGGGGSGGAILLQGRRVDLAGGRLSARGGHGGLGYTISSFRNVIRRGGEQSAWMFGAHGGDGRISVQALEGSTGGVDLRSLTGSHADLIDFYAEGAPSSDSFQPAPAYGLEGRSRWYTIGPNPTFRPAVVQGTNLSKVVVQFEGAEDDGQGQPDLATVTGWVDDLTRLDGSEHVRFRVLLTPDAEVDRIELPYGR